MKKELPNRKSLRLKGYDYSATGAYYVTICTKERKSIFSRIVGRGLAPAEIEYTKYGRIAEEQLLLLEKRYPYVKIDRYVIMPNHIHTVLIFTCEEAEASPRPTLMDVICAFKSLTARECKKNGFSDALFQTSFYEHIIRNSEEYIKIAKYIDDNPLCWYYDELYSDE